MARPFRFVMVGSGNIGKTYLQAVAALDNAEIVGIVSRYPESVRAPERVEVAAALEAIEADFDGVILATPNGLHHEGAVRAARLGKHVLTEKPLDISVAGMDLMTAACNGAGVKLGVAYQHRMSPDNRAFKELLDAGALGRVFAADFTVRCWRDQTYYDSAAWRGGWEIDGGGPFMQQACHQVDLYTWFFGLPAEVVSMTGRFLHDIEVEDHGAALFRHPDGMIGTFIASTVAYPGFDPLLIVHAEKGSVVMENGRISGWHVDGIDDPGRDLASPLHSGAASAAVTDTAGHEAILADFIDAVRCDREPAVPGASARLATELILRIYGRR